jgi:hypothetical protein
MFSLNFPFQLKFTTPFVPGRSINFLGIRGFFYFSSPLLQEKKYFQTLLWKPVQKGK